MLKHLACKIFLAAVLEDADDIGRQIATALIQDRKPTTLTKEHGLHLFALEWYVARLCFLRQKASGLKHVEYKTGLEEAIADQFTELKTFPRFDPWGIALYASLATGFAHGDLDVLGLPMTPGPIISKRYDKHVRREFPDGLATPSSDELTMIMVMGDKLCFYLDGDLEDGLNKIVAMG